ncbi:DUF1854 domain-containing protein [uncultured Hydrogenophaga sp.]|uniref:cyanophycin metabolism-associated DUF1854 family protein n=1 Tax=uncultured Hydrogenophaga sp. TaxID=199683 RepID=UPI00265DE2EB|nr:DUF1854 domain-containing protein [uncultured Hydrogenophaga sp.]
MSAPEFNLARDPHGQWICRTADGHQHAGVQAVRAFPLNAPDEAISLVGADGSELVFIPLLTDLPAERREAVRDALAEREMVPVIERIVSVSTFATPSTWEVQTDRGPTRLVLKVEEDIRRLPGQRRLLITSSHGLVFEVPDRTRLDRSSRRLLERFL